MKKHFVLYSLISVLAVSCAPKQPENAQKVKTNIAIYPDYTDAVIPWNIAPLNFIIKQDGEDFIAVSYSRKGGKLLFEGKKVQWDLNEWNHLLEENKGDTLYTEVYVKKGNQWYQYPAIKNYIATEKIDGYFSYRLIEPSYTVYEYMTINQRNLNNFEENVIYCNSLLSSNEEGHCINCHSYQDYNRTKKMQFHVRQYKGGTVIVTPSGVEKVNLKVDSTISAGVYAAWHPTKNIIAYSVNKTEQHFHKNGQEKVEVMDSKSDLILYDIDKNEVRVIANDPNELETFPAWSPDGKFLYYASAKCPKGVAKDSLILHYKDFHYNIYRRAFNMQTLEFGTVDTVFNASARNKSASFPRISPDGRYMLFTLGDYGTFHIWHKSSDLYLLDLKDGRLLSMPEINSPDVESYHSWSSNGSWIIFSSRRDDGSYTRPYISYFKNGKAYKPFIVPQKDPDFYKALFKSFNIPEFMVQPVTVPKRQLIKAIEKEPVNAVYRATKKK